MRSSSLMLTLSFQMLLVGLGAWAQVAGGPVWFLVALVMIALTAGARLMVQSECARACHPLDEEIRCLKSMPKQPLPQGGVADHAPTNADALLSKIAQLEAELRLLCPPRVGNGAEAVEVGPTELV